MPFPRIKRKEVQKTVFKSFSPDMSGSDEEAAATWEETGAFPTVASSHSRSHIFTDELSFENGLSPLEIVEEGSRETINKSHEESYTVVSTPSSETTAVDNSIESAMRKISFNQKKSSAAELESQVGTSGTSKGVYPFNIYGSLSRMEEKKKWEDEAATSSGGLSTPDKTANTSFAVGSSAASRSTVGKKVDIEEQPTSVGEESSIISDSHSQVVGNNAAQSLVSARSHRQSRRYLVRQTLSTSQQVNTNPAIMLKNLFISIEQERHMHKLAAQNLHALHNWFMFLPCIVLTLLGGLVVLVFEADLNASDEAHIYASVFVGVATLVSVFLQAVSKMLNMGTRGTLHDVTASLLKRLSEDILLTLSSAEAIPAEYVALVSEKLGQALDACPSTLPYKVEAAFSAVSDRMMLMLRPPTGQPARKHVHKLDTMRLYSIAYDELSSEIIHSWAWPFFFPRPRSVHDRALRHFKVIITEGRDTSQKKRGWKFGWWTWERSGDIELSLFEVVPAASVADGSKNTCNSDELNQIPKLTTTGHEV